MELNLFGKKELWLYDITLHKVNLNTLASTVAGVLRLPLEKVLVVDVGDDHVTFDLLCDSIQVEQLLGREQELLSALASVPGVTLNEKARIHAEGVLGFISCEKTDSGDSHEPDSEASGDKYHKYPYGLSHTQHGR
jgi:hypothetical protein